MGVKKIILELNEEEYKNIEKIISQREHGSIPELKSLSYGELQINPFSRTVFIKDKEIFLTAKEFDIVYFLASYPGLVFTHRQIYEAVWGKEYFQDAENITAHIGHIRKKLERDPQNPQYIQTVRGVGYKFAKKEAGDSM